MITGTLSNNKLNSIVTELLIRRRKLNIPLVLTRQSCFAVSKNIRLNSTHYSIIKIKNFANENFPFINSSNIYFKEFIGLYRKCTTLALDNSPRFRKNHSERI